MRNGRGGITARAGAPAVIALACIALGCLALACGVGSALAGDAARRSAAKPRAQPAPAARGPVDVETVSFGDSRFEPVRVMRGPRKSPKAAPPTVSPAIPEIVSFGTGAADRVTVLRGGPASPAPGPDPATQTRTETVAFADPLLPAVTIVRGAPTPASFLMYLFGPANGGELDRIAFAVDGVESRHGGDPRMWRPEPSGPQGPMQVSAAAAFDVGGGNRFDLWENRALGRAYLAQMFRRYGNWPDALAAYNWGPGNLDLWIAGGRRASELPLDVARYVTRVLRDAVITRAAL